MQLVVALAKKMYQNGEAAQVVVATLGVIVKCDPSSPACITGDLNHLACMENGKQNDTATVGEQTQTGNSTNRRSQMQESEYARLVYRCEETNELHAK